MLPEAKQSQVGEVEKRKLKERIHALSDEYYGMSNYETDSLLQEEKECEMMLSSN